MKDGSSRVRSFSFSSKFARLLVSIKYKLKSSRAARSFVLSFVPSILLMYVNDSQQRRIKMPFNDKWKTLRSIEGKLNERAVRTRARCTKQSEVKEGRLPAPDDKLTFYFFFQFFFQNKTRSNFFYSREFLLFQQTSVK